MHGRKAALLALISGAPPDYLQCYYSQVNHCGCGRHGEFQVLGNTQMDALDDCDRLRNNLQGVSRLPLEMKHKGQRPCICFCKYLASAVLQKFPPQFNC